MSAFSKDDIRILATREYMLDGASLSEQYSFLKFQIENPFDSGDANYFKKIRNLVNDKTSMNEICEEILKMISDAYPGMDFDLDEDMGLIDFTDSVYKFFTRSIRKEVYVFLREYLFNNKNRKGLLEDYQDLKIQNYPKTIYGKKEYYILITKMPAIVKTICGLNHDLADFIEMLDRDEDSPLYIQMISRYIDQGLIADHGIYEDIMKKFVNSDCFNSQINKLTLRVKEAIIDPYLAENGFDEVRPSIVIEPETDELSDEEDFETEPEDE